MSRKARRSHGPWTHNLCGGEGSRLCPHTLLLAESRRFSMSFLLSSGSCSSPRWKKGTDRWKAEQVESKRDNQRTHGWNGDGVKSARLNLEPQCECDDQGLWNNACRLSACCDAPRDCRSAVCQRRHWCSHCCAFCRLLL